jgi:anti-sigma B factor antagonist
VADIFKVETERTEGGLQVRLIGELDLDAYLGIYELLRNAQLDGTPDVVVDLRAVAFIDSSGIRALLAADKRAAAVGGDFRLIRGPDSFHRVFELTALDTRLHFIQESDPDEQRDSSKLPNPR